MTEGGILGLGVNHYGLHRALTRLCEVLSVFSVY